MPKQVYAELARKLREIRESPLDLESGAARPALSQKELGLRIGISTTGIAQYEALEQARGRRPPLDAIQRWAEECGYALVLELVPAGTTDELSESLRSTSPEVRRLVELRLQAAPHQPKAVLQAMELALAALIHEPDPSLPEQ